MCRHLLDIPCISTLLLSAITPITTIAAVDLHPRIDKDEVREAKLWDADRHHNRSTKRRPGAQLVANLDFNFPQVVRQHTLGLVRLYCVGFVYNLFRTHQGYHRQWLPNIEGSNYRRRSLSTGQMTMAGKTLEKMVLRQEWKAHVISYVSENFS